MASSGMLVSASLVASSSSDNRSSLLKLKTLTNGMVPPPSPLHLGNWPAGTSSPVTSFGSSLSPSTTVIRAMANSSVPHVELACEVKWSAGPVRPPRATLRSEYCLGERQRTSWPFAPIAHLARLIWRHPGEALSLEHPHELLSVDRGQRFVIPIRGRSVKPADRRGVGLPRGGRTLGVPA